MMWNDHRRALGLVPASVLERARGSSGYGFCGASSGALRSLLEPAGGHALSCVDLSGSAAQAAVMYMTAA